MACSLFPVWFQVFPVNYRLSEIQTAVVSDRIARTFKRFEANQAVARDISKVFDKVSHAGLLHELKSYEILGRIFSLVLSFFSNRWLQVILLGTLAKSIH